MKLYFEELEAIEEQGAVNDFINAAAPWAAIAVSAAIGIVAFT